VRRRTPHSGSDGKKERGVVLSQGRYEREIKGEIGKNAVISKTLKDLTEPLGGRRAMEEGGGDYERPPL